MRSRLVSFGLQLIVVLLGAVSFTLPSRSLVKQSERNSDDELNKGASAFKAKKYAEAATIFEAAQKHGSTHPGLPLFIARSLAYQYKKNDRTAANIATARKAIAAYERVLGNSEYASEAVFAITELCQQIDRDRIATTAASEATPTPLRSGLYRELASESRRCASDLVDTPASRTEIKVKDEITYRYKMPAKKADYVRAKQCADEGLRYIENALKLDPKSIYSWTVRSSLLEQLSILAEMEGDWAKRDAFQKEAEKTDTEYKRLSKVENEARDKKDQDELEQIKNSPGPGPEDAMQFVESGKYYREPANFLMDLIKSPLDFLIPPPDARTRSTDDDERRKQRAVDAKTPWRKFAPVGEGFSITMPSSVQNESSGRDSSLFIAHSEDVNYHIITMRIASDTPLVHPKAILATAAWGNITGVCNMSIRANSVCEASLVRELTLTGKPGLQYEIKQTQCSSVYPGVLRVYMKGDMLFLIQAIGARENDAKVKRFLDSFSFVS